jgi:hypothetical protein
LAGFDPLAAGPASTAAQPADPTAVQNRQDQKEAFLKGGSTETRNSGNLQMPASPYQVMAGTVIAGALVTGIKSDLPGDVIATVTEPVYDTATGKFLLIPQGSRILGKYNSQVSYGQSRVQVVWNRIILPDTSSLTLDNLAGTDPAGYAGLEDGVDWHWDRIFAGAALTTLLGVGAELAAPENRQDGNRIVIAGRDSAQDSINQVGQEMTRRNMNIQPTLTERPGLPVRIIVNRDLVLRPYQPLFFKGADAMSDQEAAARAAAQDPSADLCARACRSTATRDPRRREAVDGATLIPHMLEAFMAPQGKDASAPPDRGFCFPWIADHAARSSRRLLACNAIGTFTLIENAAAAPSLSTAANWKVRCVRASCDNSCRPFSNESESPASSFTAGCRRLFA